ATVPSEPERADPHDWGRERWRRAVTAAEWHRVAPLLYCHVRAQQGVPRAVLRELEETYLANSARNLFIDAALRQALGALREADVPALLLKGAALVETVYDDPAQREMLDLDVLVPRAELRRAAAALEPLGYAAGGSEAAAHHAPALIGEQRIVAVELHHHIVIGGEGRRFDIDDLWRRARPAPDGTHLLPAPADLLLHVCLHFTRNRLGGSHGRRSTGGALSPIPDIAR